MTILLDKFGSCSPDGTAVYAVASSSAGAPTVGVWYYVVAWYDGTRLNISVNNSPADSVSYSGGVYNGPTQFRLGTIGGNLYSLDGALDEVAIYKRALADAGELALQQRQWTHLYKGAPPPQRVGTRMDIPTLRPFPMR